MQNKITWKQNLWRFNEENKFRCQEEEITCSCLQGFALFWGSGSVKNFLRFIFLKNSSVKCSINVKIFRSVKYCMKGKIILEIIIGF